MGFNKLMLPDVDRLEEQLQSMGKIDFGKHWLRRFQKSDAIMGPDKSHDFIKPFTDHAYKEYKQIFVNNEMDTDIKK